VSNEFAAAPAKSEPTPVAFTDADGCSRWLRGLHASNIPAHYNAILGQLLRMSETECAPRERARIAEVLREPVAFLHTELARRYAGKPQPATERECDAAEQALALWHALWNQYSACLKPLLEGEPELQGVKAKLLQRGLWVGKQLLVVYGLARRLPAPDVWQELHAYYRLAEILECAVTAVSDELMPTAVGVSCYTTYVHALLLDLADPCAMTVRQIELADRWLTMWSRKVFPYAQERETEGPLIVIDLDASSGATLAPPGSQSAGESIRFGYPAKLATSVRGRLRRLATGANPAELQLGHDVSVEACAALLAHLDSRWYALPRKRATQAATSLELCVGGLAAAYFRIACRTFQRQNAPEQLSYQGAQRLATLGPVTNYDRNREEAERTWVWERWNGSVDRDEARLNHAGGGRHRWHLEQLVIVREDERLCCGYVTRVALEGERALSITLKLWPGTPSAFAAHPVTTTQSQDAPIPAILLDSSADEKACAIVPPRTFNAGRVLRLPGSANERRLRLTRLAQRGADFERVIFEEMRT